LYEYRCDACGERFEVIQKFSDPPPAACTKCGKGPVERLMSSPAIQFKGSGWYITDYAQKGKSGTDSSSSSPDGKGGAASSDSAKSDSTSKADSPGKSEAPPASGPSKSSAT
jgi:putative FmdB family regulatory protein